MQQSENEEPMRELDLERTNQEAGFGVPVKFRLYSREIDFTKYFLLKDNSQFSNVLQSTQNELSRYEFFRLSTVFDLGDAFLVCFFVI